MSSKPRLTKREREQVELARAAKKKVEAPQPITLWSAFRYLFRVLKFRFFSERFLNKQVFYRGQWRKITGETRTEFMCSDFPKIAFSKVNNPYKIK